MNFLSQEEYEHELTESLIREDTFIDDMTKIDRVLTKIYNLETKHSEHSSVRETTSNHTRSPSNPTETVKVILPKLELKPFDGNILNWQPFWDRFQSSIKDVLLNRIEHEYKCCDTLPNLIVGGGGVGLLSRGVGILIQIYRVGG